VRQKLAIVLEKWSAGEKRSRRDPVGWRWRIALRARLQRVWLLRGSRVTAASLRRFCLCALQTSSTLPRPRDRLHGARDTVPLAALSECGFRVRDNAHWESRWHAAHDGFVSSPPQRLARGVRSRAVSQYVRDDRRTGHVSDRDQRDVVHDCAAHDRGAGKARRALRVPVRRHTVPHDRPVASELTSVGRRRRGRSRSRLTVADGDWPRCAHL